VSHTQLRSILLQNIGFDITLEECDALFRHFQVVDTRLGPVQRMRYLSLLRALEVPELEDEDNFFCAK
jgi:hypothetical protein